MEEYKRSLCWHFNRTSEESIYNYTKSDPAYTCNLNEDGLLHSTYNGDHYEPAITWCQDDETIYYWLFDGKIKDCLHPFEISVCNKQITYIRYYSSERIQTNQPIFIHNGAFCMPYEEYNTYFDWFIYKDKVLDIKYKHGKKTYLNGHNNNISTTSEGYPLCDEMEAHFKFAD